MASVAITRRMVRSPKRKPARTLKPPAVLSDWQSPRSGEQLLPARLDPVLPGPAVIGVRTDQRHDRGGLGEDHLLVGGLYLAPAGRFLERRGGTGAVAHIGDGDLHGVAVHLRLDAEDLGADHE